MRKEKRKWLHRLAVAFGTAAAAVMLTQVPAAAREVICTNGVTFQLDATRTITEENDMYCGPIMPGDTVKVEGKKTISGINPETVYQSVSMDVRSYIYYPKERIIEDGSVKYSITEYPTDSYKAGIQNEQLKEILKGLEFITGKIYNQQGKYVEVITGFRNNTGKVVWIGSNGGGGAVRAGTNEPAGDGMEEYDAENNCIRQYVFIKEWMVVRIFDPECDITYELDEGMTMQGKVNPTSYRVAALEPYTVRIWAPVKEGYHFSSGLMSGWGICDGRDLLFASRQKHGQENGQQYVDQEYWPGFFARYDGIGGDRNYSFGFEPGYTAVFHGNGGTVNGQDTWISEVDQVQNETWPYTYTDVNFTPVREGYQFEGWYLDEDFNKKFYGFQDDRTYERGENYDWCVPFQNSRTRYITDLYAKWSGGTEPEPSTAPTPSTAPSPSEAPMPSEAPTPTGVPQQNVTPGNTQTPTPTAVPSASALPKKGSQHKVKGLIYKVTASTASKKTVTVMRPVKKTEKKITIPASVKLGSYTYQVTEINAKAFRNNTKLTQVTIGTKITKIKKQAFEGCKNLKKITINSKVVKKIEVNAFRKVKKGAKIYVPKAKYKAYSKYLKAAKIAKDIKVIRK